MLSCLILNDLLACGHMSPILGLRKLGFMETEDYPSRVPHNTQDYKPSVFFYSTQWLLSVGGSLGIYKKACENGPYLKELCILVETEYTHWKYKQHWPSSIGGPSCGRCKWTLGSSSGINRRELRSAWKRRLGRKGVDYSLSLIPRNQSTRKSRSRSPEFSHASCLSPCSEPPYLAWIITAAS